MNFCDTLSEALRGVAPEEICALDEGAQQTVQGLLAQGQLPLCDTSTSGSLAKLALVEHALHPLNAAQARALLTRVRDYVAPRILVIADAHCALTKLDFLALGYEILASDRVEHMTLYHFDLATYKQVPDWLNARFWAHPERWKP